MARLHRIAAAATLLACAAGGVALAQTADWRTLASAADRERLRGWRTTWVEALRQARASGNHDRIDAQGPLLNPDAGLGGPMPKAGDYRCRVIKIGATARGMADFVAEPAGACRPEAGERGLAIAKLEGAQRPAGWLYPDGTSRMVFLGSMRMADERRPLGYGGDPDRDMAGILERIGANRWRLVLPRPHWESTLTVVEIVPAR